ncbi:MAG: hypothetical protein OES18_12730 [Deltaproteobacteria bacterium]|nr:hypothetical protein [Deltaproteobacteria bacterium]
MWPFETLAELMPWWWLQARGCELSAIGTANEVKGGGSCRRCREQFCQELVVR